MPSGVSRYIGSYAKSTSVFAILLAILICVVGVLVSYFGGRVSHISIIATKHLANIIELGKSCYSLLTNSDIFSGLMFSGFAFLRLGFSGLEFLRLAFLWLRFSGLTFPCLRWFPALAFSGLAFLRLRFSGQFELLPLTVWGPWEIVTVTGMHGAP